MGSLTPDINQVRACTIFLSAAAVMSLQPAKSSSVSAGSALTTAAMASGFGYHHTSSHTMSIIFRGRHTCTPLFGCTNERQRRFSLASFRHLRETARNIRARWLCARARPLLRCSRINRTSSSASLAAVEGVSRARIDDWPNLSRGLGPEPYELALCTATCAGLQPFLRA